MSSPRTPSAVPSAVAWALLSQSVWLPLLAIDLHDHWQVRIHEQQEIAAAAARVAKQSDQLAASTGDSKVTTGLLLGSASRGLETASRSLEDAGTVHSIPAGDGPGARTGPILTTPRNPGSGPLPLAPRQAETPSPGPLKFRAISEPRGGLLSASFNRSELLGGTLSLADLQRPAMPSLALAERARWAGSSDPLAPLPADWREPIRKAIQALPGPASRGQITAARVVHVPSSRVRRSTPVPLAVQGDGSVDILSRPDDPAVVDEIRHWSRRQSPSPGTGVTAAIIHLEPIPEAPAALTPPRSLRAADTASRDVSPDHAPVQPPGHCAGHAPGSRRRCRFGATASTDRSTGRSRGRSVSPSRGPRPDPGRRRDPCRACSGSRRNPEPLEPLLPLSRIPALILASATLLGGAGLRAAEVIAPSPGSWNQAAPAAPQHWTPDWKHPGRGPVPTEAPLWRRTPSQPTPPPAWGPSGASRDGAPGWTPLPQRQGDPPLWRPL